MSGLLRVCVVLAGVALGAFNAEAQNRPGGCNGQPTCPGGGDTTINNNNNATSTATNILTLRSAAHAPSVMAAASGCQVGFGASFGVIAVSAGGNLLWMDKQCLATRLAESAFGAAASGQVGFFCVAARMASMAMPEYYSDLMNTPEVTALCTAQPRDVVVWRKGIVDGRGRLLRLSYNADSGSTDVAVFNDDKSLYMGAVVNRQGQVFYDNASQVKAAGFKAPALVAAG
ncbi:MAG: hypothetical protein EBQ96_05325 [Proteobacteria bacterium]|nr:hypothetical protein [Pseudomonadota bacterium]